MGYSGGSHRFNFGVVIDGSCNPSSLAFRIGAGPFHARENEANGSAEANGIDRGRDSTGLFAYLWMDFFSTMRFSQLQFLRISCQPPRDSHRVGTSRDELLGVQHRVIAIR